MGCYIYGIRSVNLDVHLAFSMSFWVFLVKFMSYQSDKRFSYVSVNYGTSS